MSISLNHISTPKSNTLDENIIKIIPSPPTKITSRVSCRDPNYPPIVPKSRYTPKDAFIKKFSAPSKLDHIVQTPRPIYPDYREAVEAALGPNSRFTKGKITTVTPVIVTPSRDQFDSQYIQPYNTATTYQEKAKLFAYEQPALLMNNDMTTNEETTGGNFFNNNSINFDNNVNPMYNYSSKDVLNYQTRISSQNQSPNQQYYTSMPQNVLYPPHNPQIPLSSISNNISTPHPSNNAIYTYPVLTAPQNNNIDVSSYSNIGNFNGTRVYVTRDHQQIPPEFVFNAKDVNYSTQNNFNQSSLYHASTISPSITYSKY